MSSQIAQIEETTFDGLRAWKLISATGAEATIVANGAALVSWQPKPGKEVIDGYVNAEEVLSCLSARSQVTAPWVGRIKHAEYVFEGKTYKLPANEHGVAIHGLVNAAEFALVNAGSALTLRYSFPGAEGYPWTFDLDVTYSLENGADGAEHLSFTAEATNTSDQVIPFAIGWHPYVRIPGQKTISNTALTIPARTKILLDSDSVPRPGEAAYAGVQAPFEVDYLGTTRIDTSYRGLIPDDDGVVTTVLQDLSSAASVKITQEPAQAPVMHVFTSDGLPRNERASIALEPLSHLADAFNRADSQASVKLAPGAQRGITATITYTE
ncbi:MAG: aldose 1-epimerase [Arcanobacterium sp.]|nr:aldose 1-epimerase [Arcanobacterium sp.]